MVIFGLPLRHSMDSLDLKIIEKLSQNARKSFRQIAKELDVSMSTVSNRVKALEKEGIIIGYAPIIDSQKLGYDILVLIFVRITRGRLMEVQNKIAEHEKVISVYDMTGDWDSLVMARFKTRTEVNNFVKNVMNSPFIERTNTQMVLNVVKEESRLLLPGNTGRAIGTRGRGF